MDEGHRHEHGHAAGDKKEADFFHEHSQAMGRAGWEDPMTQSSHSSTQSGEKSKNETFHFEVFSSKIVFFSSLFWLFRWSKYGRSNSRSKSFEQRRDTKDFRPEKINHRSTSSSTSEKGQKDFDHRVDIVDIFLWFFFLVLERFWCSKSSNWFQGNRTKRPRTGKISWTTSDSRC